MNNIVKFLILSLFAVAALGSYSYGNSTGMFVFIILGFVFEALFWTGLFRKKQSLKSH